LARDKTQGTCTATTLALADRGLGAEHTNKHFAKSSRFALLATPLSSLLNDEKNEESLDE
jgi:hypothetical protein